MIIIRKGGYILSNNYHGNASHMYNNPDAFELVGVIDFVESDRRKGDNRAVFSRNLEELREVRPETYEFIRTTFNSLIRRYHGDRRGDTEEERYRIIKGMMG